MSSFYIDKDLRSGRVFIAPLEKSPLGPFVIECDKAYQANDLLKKLNSKLLKDPYNDAKIWIEDEPLKGPLGTVRVFKLKKT